MEDARLYIQFGPVKAMRFLVLISAVVLLLLIEKPAVEAAPVFIDNFRIDKNGGLLFEDTFSDGVPPPSAPNLANGNATSYFVSGTLDEADGKARLDTTGAEIVPGVGGGFFFLERARLNTNIDPTNLTIGLKNDDTFSVTGIFDLTVPTLNREAYGVELTDRTVENPGDDILRLQVRRGVDGVSRISFRQVDLVANIVTPIANTTLDPLHDQVALRLSRLSATDDAIAASFFYLDGGVGGPVTTFAATTDIFHDENFTRATFQFESPVPEPSDSLLLISGFLSLLVMVKFKSWKQTTLS